MVSDPELFDALLKESDLKYEDVGGTVNREKSKLLSYTINLNPALQAVVANIVSHREEVGTAENAIPVKYTYRSISLVNAIEQRVNPSFFSVPRLCNWIERMNLSRGAEIIASIPTHQVNGLLMDTIIVGNGNGPSYSLLEKIGIMDIEQLKLISAWQNWKSQELQQDVLENQVTEAPVNDTSTELLTINALSPVFGSIARPRKSFTEDKDISKILPENLPVPVESHDRTTEDKNGNDHIGY
jgi:hypothetical protein